MRRSRLVLVTAFATLLPSIVGCGNSAAPPLTDSKLSDVAQYASLSLVYSEDEAKLSVQISNPAGALPGFYDDEGNLISCPNLHATATANGQPMQLQEAAVSKEVSASPSDDGSVSISYQCSAPVFMLDGPVSDILDIEITDESGSMTFDASELVIHPTMTLDRSILRTNDIVNVTTNPPLTRAALDIDLALWQENEEFPRATITGTGFTFVVPDQFATSSTPPGDFSDELTIYAGDAWSSSIAQCNGAAHCDVTRVQQSFSFDMTLVTVAPP